jgi:hypothetical protein
VQERILYKKLNMFKWKIKNDLPYAWEAAGTEFAESAISVWRPTK